MNSHKRNVSFIIIVLQNIFPPLLRFGRNSLVLYYLNIDFFALELSTAATAPPVINELIPGMPCELTV